MPENASPVAPVQNSVHTPGPWNVSGYRVCGFPNGRVKVVCDTANNIKTRTDENAANAKLIALAPEMLELLRKLVHGELPEADEDCTPDTVKLTVSHMDHEDYRHRIRQAKELISRVV